jgi:hypothetical protein
MPYHHERAVACSSAVQEIGNTQPQPLLLVLVALPLMLVQNQLLAADPRGDIGLTRLVCLSSKR